jgi:hypothetical protein
MFGAPRALAMFADWSDRITKGEVPAPPPRPQGLERNVVITQWYWADPKVYMHDQVSTDRRQPTVNASGPIYGAPELSADYIPVLDPVSHTPTRIPVSPRDPKTPVAPNQVLQSSAYWGREAIWTSRMDIHNPMIDGQGRVWMTARVRPPQNPDFCKKGSSHLSAKLFPIDQEGHADQHVLRHPSFDVCGGREQYPLVQRLRQPLFRVDQHETVR